jgi:hypothetical protein
MKSDLTARQAPDVSAEQQTLDRTRKQLRKLRWIGRGHDAERMLMMLCDERLRSPAPDERRRSIRLLAMPGHSTA